VNRPSQISEVLRLPFFGKVDRQKGSGKEKEREKE
jgi:hypothetical protein